MLSADWRSCLSKELARTEESGTEPIACRRRLVESDVNSLAMLLKNGQASNPWLALQMTHRSDRGGGDGPRAVHRSHVGWTRASNSSRWGRISRRFQTAKMPFRRRSPPLVGRWWL